MTTTPNATRPASVRGVVTPSVADYSNPGTAVQGRSSKLEAAHEPAVIRWQAMPAGIGGGYLAAIGRQLSPA